MHLYKLFTLDEIEEVEDDAAAEPHETGLYIIL